MVLYRTGEVRSSTLSKDYLRLPHFEYMLCTLSASCICGFFFDMLCCLVVLLSIFVSCLLFMLYLLDRNGHRALRKTHFAHLLFLIDGLGIDVAI